MEKKHGTRKTQKTKEMFVKQQKGVGLPGPKSKKLLKKQEEEETDMETDMEADLEADVVDEIVSESDNESQNDPIENIEETIEEEEEEQEEEREEIKVRKQPPRNKKPMDPKEKEVSVSKPLPKSVKQAAQMCKPSTKKTLVKQQKGVGLPGPKSKKITKQEEEDETDMEDDAASESASEAEENSVQDEERDEDERDFLGMSVNEALDIEFLYSKYPNDEASCKINMGHLFSLYTLVQKEILAESMSNSEIETNAVEEYVVENITAIELIDDDACYLIKWLGYKEPTWETVKNIFDCQKFRDYTAEFFDKNKELLDKVWDNLKNNAKSPKTNHVQRMEKIKTFDYYQFQSNLFLLAAFEIAKLSESTKEYRSVKRKVTDVMQYVDIYLDRLDQLRALNDIEISINKIEEKIKVHIVNSIDFESPPFDRFKYVKNVIAKDINVPNEPPFGCACKGGICSDKTKCCPSAAGTEFAYTKDGLICVPQGTPIYECNKTCKCTKKCQNRVVQNGHAQSLCIFKTGNHRGWGVRTEVAIRKGVFVCECVGEIITSEESEQRGRIYDAEGQTYLFDLDFNELENPYTIDTANNGNLSRFLNHSCEPNLGVWAVWADCLDVNLPKLCFFTLRDIEANEELTFDYSYSTDSNVGKKNGAARLAVTSNNESNNNTPKSKVGKVVKDFKAMKIKRGNEGDDDDDASASESDEEPNGEEGPKGFECRCGCAHCRGIIYC